MALELFQFQQDAASQMADRYFEYDADPVVMGRRDSKREVPFYQALSSITGSGRPQSWRRPSARSWRCRRSRL